MTHRTSPPCWSEVTALFGGRFDPPHLGHREAVRGLFREPGIREVLILPSPAPAYKPTTASIHHRIELAKLNFASTPLDPMPLEIRLETSEIERSIRQPNSPTYSFDTLMELKRTYSQLAFVIGTDQLQQFHTWHRFPEVLGLCHWIVLARKSSSQPSTETKLIDQTLAEFKASGLIQDTTAAKHWKIKPYFSQSTFLHVVNTDAPCLSSTEIRESLAQKGTPPPGSLLDEVEGYLKTHKLYGI